MVKYNQSYDAAYSNTAHSVTGVIDKHYNDFQYFFQLKQTNKSLAEENAKLRTALDAYIRNSDTLNSNKLISIVDSIKTDSSSGVQKYEYYEAKVVNNSTTNDNNFITIEKGANQGIQKNMTVAGPSGIVGRVVAVSPDYSVVMSLLNPNTKVMARIKGVSSSEAFIDWNGKKANIVQLNNVLRTVHFKTGDSVLTSNVSDFPENIMVGRIVNYSLNPANGSYNINVATSTDFYSLQYVYVIKNNFLKEQQALEDSAKQKQP